MRSEVVLPAPFGPSRPSTWPFSTRNDRSDTARCPLLYALVRPVIWSGTSASSGSYSGAGSRRRPVSTMPAATASATSGSAHTHAGSGAACVRSAGTVGTVSPDTAATL
ncbi:hypothetical protein ACIBF1_41210 [Spirillospora sp. NPDC050679]